MKTSVVTCSRRLAFGTFGAAGSARASGQGRRGRRRFLRAGTPGRRRRRSCDECRRPVSVRTGPPDVYLPATRQTALDPSLDNGCHITLSASLTPPPVTRPRRPRRPRRPDNNEPGSCRRDVIFAPVLSLKAFARRIFTATACGNSGTPRPLYIEHAVSVQAAITAGLPR